MRIHPGAQPEIAEQHHAQHEIVERIVLESERTHLQRGDAGHAVVAAERHVARRVHSRPGGEAEEGVEQQGQHQRQDRHDPGRDAAVEHEVTERRGDRGRRRKPRHHAGPGGPCGVREIAGDDAVEISGDREEGDLPEAEHPAVAPEQAQPQRQRDVEQVVGDVGRLERRGERRDRRAGRRRAAASTAQAGAAAADVMRSVQQVEQPSEAGRACDRRAHRTRAGRSRRPSEETPPGSTRMISSAVSSSAIDAREGAEHQRHRRLDQRQQPAAADRAADHAGAAADDHRDEGGCDELLAHERRDRRGGGEQRAASPASAAPSPKVPCKPAAPGCRGRAPCAGSASSPAPAARSACRGRASQARPAARRRVAISTSQ